MALVLANNASTTLASGVTNSATSISVASASGFPSISVIHEWHWFWSELQSRNSLLFFTIDIGFLDAWKAT